MSIAENLAEIRGRMALAAGRAGRDAGEVALMAVSKTHPAEAIVEAMAAGQTLFGENRVQEFAGKRDAVLAGIAEGSGGEGKTGQPRFHLIGHLQSNKAARAVELFDGVESVDSIRLAERLNEAAEKLEPTERGLLDSRFLGRRLDVLIEVNVGGEAAKSGLAVDSDELLALVDAQSKLPHLVIRGLMTVPPFTEDAEGARGCFRQLRELRDRLRARSGLGLAELSMGMSHDFEVAIEEGSTCVRVGTAIFGARSYPEQNEAG
jgi:hypothetical protein